MPSRTSSPASVRSYASVASEAHSRSNSPIERSDGHSRSPAFTSGSKSSDTAVSGPIHLVEKYLPGGQTINVQVQKSQSEAGDDVISLSSDFTDDGARLDPDDAGYRGKTVNTRVVGTETQSIIQTRSAKRKSAKEGSSNMPASSGVSSNSSGAGHRDAAHPLSQKGGSSSSKGAVSFGTSRFAVDAGRDVVQAVNSKAQEKATRSVGRAPVQEPHPNTSTSKAEKKSKRTRSRDERDPVPDRLSKAAQSEQPVKSRRSRRDEGTARVRSVDHPPAPSSTDAVPVDENDGLSDYERARKKVARAQRRSQRMVVTPEPSTDGSMDDRAPDEDNDVSMDQYDMDDPFIDDSAVVDAAQDDTPEAVDPRSQPVDTRRNRHSRKETVDVVKDRSPAASISSKHRSSDKGKGVDRSAGRTLTTPSFPPIASAPLTGAVPVTPTPSSKRAAASASTNPVPQRRTFGDVLGKGKGSQSQTSSPQGQLGGNDVVTLDDVVCLPVRDIPTKSEVMYPDLQDALLVMFYTDLPPLRAGVFVPWRDAPVRGMIRFSTWADECSCMSYTSCLNSINFARHGVYLNLSRVSLEEVSIRSVPNARSTFQLYTNDRRIAICLSCVFVDKSFLFTKPPWGGFHQRWFSGVLHSQEWERLVGFICTAFGHNTLEAQLYRCAIQFSTRPLDSSDGTNRSSPAKEHMFTASNSPSIARVATSSSASSADSFSLSYHSEVPIYDCRDIDVDMVRDLDRLSELPRWNEEIPYGSFVVAGYTVAVFKKAKDKWGVSFNVRFGMLIGVPDDYQAGQ
ncbi:hypothetical protein EST38_g12042 [Candolleomyces aberdarensis]|uniref:Uncharacterized protein n=1 Tax=Candolleomyces aberdarensis TaxID=2316362 RepID=A0A4Q2D606_9AGAR|nr:hypothetical protein EST38_g12042 [Candolleomyces aberdarensis]